MDGLSTKSKLHSRLSVFVTWIAPEPETREAIKNQSNEIRGRLSAKATEDNLIVTMTPNSGSFAKKTGLRRHLRGDSEVEGQDVDLPFVVKIDQPDSSQLEPMIGKFFHYCELSYPNTDKEKTKSSVELKFSNTLKYDIVPLFATDDPEVQILVRLTGEEIRTSVQKHTDFIKSRTKKSSEKNGVVLFNECVRLMKWWRDVRCAEANYLKEVPSIMIDLLCAHAFDELSVQPTYAQTLAEWCTYLAHVVTKRKPIVFTDYNKKKAADAANDWRVLDPVNPDNNIVKKLQSYEVDELAEWFQNARDIWNRAIAAELKGDDTLSLEHLVALFGNAFKNHCED
ncbi:MAG: hypothetical protein HY033_10265 [Ignavibacteriae bacterium]|nr:hypothetical protein [Ignavibacteria bacterium]MBI3365280.1 hypothetical protein [Ignavibacteriota bacterium]